MTRFCLIAACAAAVLSTSIRETAAAGGLKKSVAEVVKAAQAVPDERRKLLDPIAKSIAAELKLHNMTAVVFVCTHNSRRSQFSQVWAHTAAAHYGLERVRFASGGTEATAANIRTVLALRRAGFSIKVTTTGENPVYAVTGLGEKTACHMFSKIYSDKSNPRRRFVAVICCSDADEKCPVVEGAASRFALHYIDPKISDGTPKENVTYDDCCRQIATEMFYLVSQVKKQTAADNEL